MGGWAPAPYERQPDGNHANLPGAGTPGDQADVKAPVPASGTSPREHSHELEFTLLFIEFRGAAQFSSA